MAVALGSVSHDIYDAAAKMLENKRIQTQLEIARAQIKAQQQQAAMQMGQNLLRMANENSQRAQDRATQKQREQLALQEREQARLQQKQNDEARQQQALLKQLSDLQHQHEQEAMRRDAAGFEYDPRDVEAIRKLRADKADIGRLSDVSATEKLIQQIQKQQQINSYVPTIRKTPTLSPQQQVQQNLVRIGPDNQVLKPNDPFVPGETKGIWQPDGKGGGKYNPISEPKQVDPEIAKQKIAAQAAAAELKILADKRHIEQTIRKSALENGMSGNEPEVQAKIDEEVGKLGDVFQRQFGFKPPTLAQPAKAPAGDDPLAASDAQLLPNALGIYQRYKDVPNRPPHIEKFMDEAKAIIDRSAAREQRSSTWQSPVSQPQASQPPAPTINGNPVSPFAQYVLGKGSRATKEDFLQSPFAANYVANALGNQDEAYKFFDQDRTAVIKMLPSMTDGQLPANLKPGDLFLGADQQLHQVQSGVTPSAGGQMAAGGGGGGGGGDAGFRPMPVQRPQAGGSGEPAPPPARNQAAPPQQPAAQPSVPVSEVFGSQAERRLPSAPDGQDMKTTVFLDNSPASQKWIDEVYPKLTKDQQASLQVEKLNKADPNSNWELADKFGVKTGNGPQILRQEWNGRGYEVTGKPATVESLGETAAALNPIGPMPPNGQPRDMTYVFVKKGSADEKRWQDSIVPRLSPEEKQGLTVYSVDTKPLPKDGPITQAQLKQLQTNERARSHGFDPESDDGKIVRGTWDQRKQNYVENDSTSFSNLKSWREFKDYLRPTHEKIAESIQKTVDENEHLDKLAAENKQQQQADANESLNQKFDQNMQETGSPLSADLPFRDIGRPMSFEQWKASVAAERSGASLRDMETGYGAYRKPFEAQGYSAFKDALDSWRNSAETADPNAAPVKPPTFNPTSLQKMMLSDPSLQKLFDKGSFGTDALRQILPDSMLRGNELRKTYDAAREAMQMWKKGYRPDDGTSDTEKKLEETQQQLEQLQQQIAPTVTPPPVPGAPMSSMDSMFPLQTVSPQTSRTRQLQQPLAFGSNGQLNIDAISKELSSVGAISGTGNFVGSASGRPYTGGVNAFTNALTRAGFATEAATPYYPGQLSPISQQQPSFGYGNLDYGTSSFNPMAGSVNMNNYILNSSANNALMGSQMAYSGYHDLGTNYLSGLGSTLGGSYGYGGGTIMPSSPSYNSPSYGEFASPIDNSYYSPGYSIPSYYEPPPMIGEY